MSRKSFEFPRCFGLRVVEFRGLVQACADAERCEWALAFSSYDPCGQQGYYVLSILGRQRWRVFGQSHHAFLTLTGYGPVRLLNEIPQGEPSHLPPKQPSAERMETVMKSLKLVHAPPDAEGAMTRYFQSVFDCTDPLCIPAVFPQLSHHPSPPSSSSVPPPPPPSPSPVSEVATPSPRACMS